MAESSVRALVVALQAIYTIGAVGLALYGLNALWLTLIAWRRKPVDPAPAPLPFQWPAVTVQLPMYNERHVVERLVNAVAALDYPRDLLQIQLLDDSDDGTATLSARLAARWARRGLDVTLVRRPNRAGFKAGALAYALPYAQGELIAIFDADFVPEPDFLKRTVPAFLAPGSEDLAFLQARWEHLNRDHSLLTRCQALALDGHFAVEQPARRAAGFAFGFNGSAGIWRRAAIEAPAVGGWQADTLCEDLDLAYRVQLAGWRGTFLESEAAPAEIPPQLVAFKRQQARWAQGSIQTLRKLGARVLRSDWPLTKRAAALAHLGSYLTHPFLLLIVLSNAPLLLLHAAPPALLMGLGIASLGPPLLYTLAQRRLHPDRWLSHLAVLPLLMLFGLGLSWTNTLAVTRAFRRDPGSFARTPKFQAEPGSDAWRQSSYRLPVGRAVLMEGLLALYAGAGVIAGVHNGNLWGAAFLALFALGFGAMVAVELWQARATRPAALSPAAPAAASVSVPATEPLDRG